MVQVVLTRSICLLKINCCPIVLALLDVLPSVPHTGCTAGSPLAWLMPTSTCLNAAASSLLPLHLLQALHSTLALTYRFLSIVLSG